MLTEYEKTEFMVSSFLFIVIYCFIRPIILQIDFKSSEFLTISLLYALWYFLTKNIKNFIK
jgi:hypothetical protein